MTERVAIVHDWLTSMRGGERVVEVLCDMYPSADVFTLTWDPTKLSTTLARQSVTTSFIHRVSQAPFVNGRFRGLLPLFPHAVESFDLSGYDVVISSSHCVAIGARAPSSAVHVAYVHSTLRYVREAQASYEASVPGGEAGRTLFRSVAGGLRRWDTRAASRPDVLIANSTYTKDRIRRYYDRDSLVIEPPIDTARFERAATSVTGQNDHSAAPFLVVSALVPNKRVELAVRAFEGRPEQLIIVGDGPERSHLQSIAGRNVTLLGWVDDAALESLYGRCAALVHTAVDDFGMVMAEALAAGKPVIACAEGGALDLVREGETGLLIAAPTCADVRGALDRFARTRNDFRREVLQTYARRFDRSRFEKRFADALGEARRQREEAKRAGDPGRRIRRRSRVSRMLKRATDVTLAAPGLIATAPLLAVLTAAIRLESRGSALFSQTRVGLDQREFTLYKLRTMDSTGRVTRIGRLLRPTGLDELPQLWNVLNGDMSLIGPRPEVPGLVAQYEREHPGYRARHSMRPGITGWAQVNGLRGRVPIGDRLKFDLEYVHDWGPSIDLKVAAATGATVVRDTIRALR